MTEAEIKAKIKASGVQYEMGVLIDPIPDPSKMTEKMQDEIVFYIFEYLKKEGFWEYLGIKGEVPFVKPKTKATIGHDFWPDWEKELEKLLMVEDIGYTPEAQARVIKNTNFLLILGFIRTILSMQKSFLTKK